MTPLHQFGGFVVSQLCSENIQDKNEGKTGCEMIERIGLKKKAYAQKGVSEKKKSTRIKRIDFFRMHADLHRDVPSGLPVSLHALR